MSSADFQQYMRILIYSCLGALASHGITTPDSSKTIILAVAGFVANFIWTMYGTRLNGLLEQIKAKTGVQSIEIKVDPNLITPSNVTANTSPGIVATPAPPAPLKV
jgi:hypothetical protein